MTLPKVSGLRNGDVPVTVKLDSASLCSTLSEKLENVGSTLSERDKTQILEWNRSLPESVESCVHKVFEQQEHARPHAPAICSWDGELSYNELEELSTRLANYLVSLGIGPEMSVPLFFDKSMWAIVAMVGILKAGGVCVSLNTTHPTVRLECIIQDVGASVVLVSAAYGHRFDHMVKSVVVEQTLFHDLAVDRSAIRALVKPTNLAFIVFTSGSTGRPKGIMLEHRSVCASARARGIAVGINHESRVLQFAAYSFDVSISDIFITLMHGGCVCVPSEYDRLHNLTGAINTMRVTQTQLTPTVAELLRPCEVPSLKVLLLGGELMKPGNVSVWAGSVDLHNVYGPSECTIDCVANIKLKADSNPANIGHGMGALLWIADSSDHNQLAPVGSVGELLVEGPVVARGYLNEAEKTANAFVTNPAWIIDGSGRQRRMYKTGDLVQYASDGSIIFVGRKDTQIKLRGQRLELGEIEYHLSRYFAAAALSVVVLPRKGPYYSKLVAVFQLKKRSCELPITSDGIHLVSRTDMKTIRNNISQMFNHLKKQLPESQVPTVWICIERIPLLSSAKIDRLEVCSWLECLTFDELCAISENSGGVGKRITCDEPIALAISGKLASLVASGNAELRASLEGQDILLCLSGLDSITSITLMNFIRRTYHVTVTPERFFRSETTIRGLAEHINSLRLGAPEETPRLDIMAEFLVLKDQLRSLPCCLQNNLSCRLPEIRNVFVTGTTGYLGTQILRALLADSDIRNVIVHVRGRTIEHATERLVTSATLAGWWSDSYFKRLEVWLGDLRQPQLGLSKQQWDCLSGCSTAHREHVNAIIHNGAAVYWNADYRTLKSVNVQSTINLLSAATTSASLRKLVYVSGGHFRRDGEGDSNQAVIDQLSISNGYSQTKFISELLVEEADRGECRRNTRTEIERDSGNSHHHDHRHHHHCRLSILKPGIIIGAAHNGRANVDDFLWRLVAGAIQLKSYDDESGDAWLYIADVERVAHAFLEELFKTSINDDGDSESSTTPVIYTSIGDGLMLRAFWAIFRDLGYELRPVTRWESWLAALQTDVEKTGEKHPLWPVLPSLGQAYASLGRRRKDMQAAVVGVETKEQVKNSCDMRTESVKEAIRRNVQYLVGIGFLPSPGGERRMGVEVGLEEGKEEMKRREVSNRSRNGWLPNGVVRVFDGVAADGWQGEGGEESEAGT